MGKQHTLSDIIATLAAQLELAQAALAQLAHAEVMLPLPERGKDRLDLASRAVPCPACKARTGNACAWARSHVDASWLAHPSRRALVERDEQLVARFAALPAAPALDPPAPAPTTVRRPRKARERTAM